MPSAQARCASFRAGSFYTSMDHDLNRDARNLRPDARWAGKSVWERRGPSKVAPQPPAPGTLQWAAWASGVIHSLADFPVMANLQKFQRPFLAVRARSSRSAFLWNRRINRAIPLIHVATPF